MKENSLKDNENEYDKYEKKKWRYKNEQFTITDTDYSKYKKRGLSIKDIKERYAKCSDVDTNK